MKWFASRNYTSLIEIEFEQNRAITLESVGIEQGSLVTTKDRDNWLFIQSFSNWKSWTYSGIVA